MATSSLISSSTISTVFRTRSPPPLPPTSLQAIHLNRFAPPPAPIFHHKNDAIVRHATPETAGDLLSSAQLALPGLPLPQDSDHPQWFAGIAALCVTVPLIIQRILSLTKEVDMAAEMVEKIAETVEDVAEKVDKAAEDLEASLPDGGLKKMVHFVEELAEETAKDAQKVEDLTDKVEEIDDKLEEFLNTKFKGTEGNPDM